MVHKRLRPVLLVAGILVVLALLLVVSGILPLPWRGAFSGGQRDLTEAERASLTAAVESSLPGGTQARFVWYPLREKAEGVYCGLINTSNVVGDHSEDRLFEVVFVPGTDHGIKSVTSVYMPGDDASWRRIIRDNCAKAGYVAAAPGGADAP